jgi:hypothetical protein
MFEPRFAFLDSDPRALPASLALSTMSCQKLVNIARATNTRTSPPFTRNRFSGRSVDENNSETAIDLWHFEIFEYNRNKLIKMLPSREAIRLIKSA